MDFKRKLSNVSFGGNWSEELVEQKELEEVLYDLEWAVENCRDQNVHSEGVHRALDYVEMKIEKGPMHRASFEKAMGIENQKLRQDAMRVAFERIRAWSGF